MEVNDILVLLVNHNRKKEYLSDFTLQHYRKKLLSIYKIEIPKTLKLSSGTVKLYYLNIIKVKKIYSKRK